MSKDRFLKYVEVCERAEAKYPSIKKHRITNLMDIESADEQFKLRLDEWIKADDLDFYHDFLGIIRESDRSTFPATFGLFVPRFATR